MHPTGAEFGEDNGVPWTDRDAIELVESVCEIVCFAVARTVAGDLAPRRRDHEGAGPRRSQAANEAGISGREQHADRLQRSVGTHDIEVGAVSDIEVAVVTDSEIQRPVQSARQHRASLAAAENLGDLTGEVRDEQPVVDKGQIVQPRSELSQQGLLAAARIDPQHLPAGHLRGDDEALRIELHRVGHTEVARNPLRLTVFIGVRI